MGGGCGPVPNDVELSVARGYLAATTLTCPDGKQVALFGGGFDDGFVFKNDVDVFDCDFDISETSLSQPRSNLAATTLTCKGKQFALFGGGLGSSGASNDVDVFACCDTNNSKVERLEPLILSQSRFSLAATTMTCNGKQFALFGGGRVNFTGDYNNNVDVFGCCDETCDVQLLYTLELSQPRTYLAATTLTCPDGKQFALFGGGYDDDDRNDVDVFACCDETCDVQFLNTIYLSQPRSRLAATTLICNGKQFALFGGGVGNDDYRDDVDVFACCDNNGEVERVDTVYLSQPRSFLAATTLTCNGRQFALFGGGFTTDSNPSKVVDIFGCCDTNCDLIEHIKTVYLSKSRGGLASITMNDCCNREIVLFGGGSNEPIFINVTFNDVDIFDCEDILG